MPKSTFKIMIKIRYILGWPLKKRILAGRPTLMLRIILINNFLKLKARIKKLTLNQVLMQIKTILITKLKL
jgi:hypothetical protein